RPVHVREVVDVDGVLGIRSVEGGEWSARTIINATGTWTNPFVPSYPGQRDFAGEQWHTVAYPGAEHFRGKRVIVVGGGTSAVQFLGELAPVTDVLWATRRPPLGNSGGFSGRQAIAMVQERVAGGLPPASVVSVTGLALRPQEEAARRTGVYDRRLPMFQRLETGGVRWADGTFEPVDAGRWAPGARPALRPLPPPGPRRPA